MLAVADVGGGLHCSALPQLFTGLFLPDYNKCPADATSWEQWRWFLDGRLCAAWYILTAAVWYGHKVRAYVCVLLPAACSCTSRIPPTKPNSAPQIGLFQAPVRVARFVAPLPILLHFFGVATLRVYPFLNRAGIDLPSAVMLLVFRYVPCSLAAMCARWTRNVTTVPAPVTLGN